MARSKKTTSRLTTIRLCKNFKDHAQSLGHSGDIVLQFDPSLTGPEETGIINFIASELHMGLEEVADTLMHFGSELCIQSNFQPIHERASGGSLFGKDILLHIASGPNIVDQSDESEHSGHATSSRSRKVQSKGKGVGAEESEVSESGLRPTEQTESPESAEQSAVDGKVEQKNDNVESEANSGASDHLEVVYTFERRKWLEEDNEWEEFSTEPDVKISCKSVWVSLESNAEITNLIKTAETLIQERIDSNESLRKAEEDARLAVPFRASIKNPDPPGSDVWVSLSDNKFNVRNIRDVFRNPSRPTQTRVHVIFDIEISEEDPIETPGIHDPSHKGYEIIRLGYKKRAEIEDSSRGVRYEPDPERPLLAWRGKGDTHPMSLFSIHAYDFGDYCIGDSETSYGYEEENFNTRRQLLRPFAGYEKKEELQNAIEAYLRKKPRPKIGSGVPFIPSYCFNRLRYLEIDQTGFGLRDNEPRNDLKVQIVVRCVNHLQQPDKFGNRTDFMDFPQSIVLDVAAQSDAEDIWEEIIPKLKAKNETNLTGQLHPTSEDWVKFQPSADLWTEPLGETWTPQLWVSPQMHGARKKDLKMYFFSKAAQEQEPMTLSRFLNRHSLRRGVRRLYVEVHFRPDNSEDWAITGTIVDKAPPFDAESEDHDEPDGGEIL
ncbi:hypothetical protein BST61_g1261 [Cercospora zeina]